eukprot:TRINITY_DN23720_c2_g1_i1.p1 TRINITY_DN23720_c2_g1~~TRINITY_DN23720_c2_g1_i1.p1  ORF type:complete len:411 (-),score=47.85 TRINITY_DN23720_c2_g1_i1:959-2149(-)
MQVEEVENQIHGNMSIYSLQQFQPRSDTSIQYIMQFTGYKPSYIARYYRPEVFKQKQPRQNCCKRNVIVKSKQSPSYYSDTEEEERHLNVLQRIVLRLRDFGFGKRNIWEGGVGWFVIGGIGLFFALISWARGANLRTSRGYQLIIQFPNACGISVGTPVRIRQVQVGSVLSVNPHLDRVDVLAEVNDENTVVPTNSMVEATRSGLIAEPFVDITPGLPIPTYQKGPLDQGCADENQIVCNEGTIQGQPGVAMDDLVYICTKLAKQMDTEGLDQITEATQMLEQMVEKARPLVDRASQLADEVIPLLGELRQGQLLDNVEALTKSAADAAHDIQRLQQAVLDESNVQALRESVSTLTHTLRHIEGIAGDVGVLTGDDRVRSSMRQIIEALGRLVED